MRIKKILNPKIPLICTLLATTSGCISPIPNYCRLRDKHADHDMLFLQNNVCLPDHPLTLADIIEIAVQRNLDVQLQKMEEAFQSERVFAQKLRMLPDGIANADMSNRDSNPGWFSRTVNLPGGPGPIGPFATQSTSKWTRLYDLTAAWNVIDFGLSYIRTQQEKNKFLLTRQKNLRARQNLVLDIYRAYYRAIVAQQAVDQSKVLIGSLQKRQETLKRQIAEQVVSEMQGLVNENRLLDLQIKLFAFENEYKSAVTELSALMGLPPGPYLQLAPGEFEDVEIDGIAICDFEKMALRYRPELLAQDMQYTIDTEEVKASMIEMLPNARLFASIWHDDDMFIYVNDWFKFGTTLSWNLLQMPAKWANTDSLDVRAQIAWETRLSMSMGVLTQVHLSYINIQESKVQYGLAKDLFSVKNRQLEVANVLERSGELSIDDVLVFEVESLFARVNAIKAFSNLQIALEQLGNSVGRPMLLSGGPLNALALGLENYCANYDDDLPMFDSSKIKRTPAEIFVVKEVVEERAAPAEEASEEDLDIDQPEEEVNAQEDQADENSTKDNSDDEFEMLEKSYNSYIREHKAELEKNIDPKSLAPSADEANKAEQVPIEVPAAPRLQRSVKVKPAPLMREAPSASPASSSLIESLTNTKSKSVEPKINPNSDRSVPNLSQWQEKKERSIHGPQYVK